MVSQALSFPGAGHQSDTLSTCSSLQPLDRLLNNLRSRSLGQTLPSVTHTMGLSTTKQPRVSPLAPNFQGADHQWLAEHELSALPFSLPAAPKQAQNKQKHSLHSPIHMPGHNPAPTSGGFTLLEPPSLQAGHPCCPNWSHTASSQQTFSEPQLPRRTPSCYPSAHHSPGHQGALDDNPDHVCHTTWDTPEEPDGSRGWAHVSFPPSKLGKNPSSSISRLIFLMSPVTSSRGFLEG